MRPIRSYLFEEGGRGEVDDMFSKWRGVVEALDYGITITGRTVIFEPKELITAILSYRISDIRKMLLQRCRCRRIWIFLHRRCGIRLVLRRSRLELPKERHAMQLCAEPRDP